MGKIAVKQLRKNLNLTLKEMAERLGVNKYQQYGVGKIWCSFKGSRCISSRSVME